MFDPRGIALGLAEHSPFAPPHRSEGPERRTTDDGGASHPIRRFQTFIAQALDEAEAAWRPRLTRYPY